MRRIVVINQKGGVGKTTTACNLAAALVARRQKVLTIDLDPQAHLTLHLGAALTGDRPSSYDVLRSAAGLDEATLKVRKNLWLVASHPKLANAEAELVSVVGRDVLLRDAIRESRRRYDILLIDCPPSLGILTVNALAAASEVMIPLQAHFLGLQGMSELLKTVALVQRRINADLRVTGIVLCMFEAGTRLATEVVEDLSRFLDSARGSDVPWATARLYDAVIRRNVKLAECPSYGMTIFDYEPRCNGALDYARLAAEVLESAATGLQPAEPGGVAAVSRSAASAEPALRIEASNAAESASASTVAHIA